MQTVTHLVKPNSLCHWLPLQEHIDEVMLEAEYFFGCEPRYGVGKVVFIIVWTALHCTSLLKGNKQQISVYDTMPVV